MILIFEAKTNETNPIIAAQEAKLYADFQPMLQAREALADGTLTPDTPTIRNAGEQLDSDVDEFKPPASTGC
jgi:hypothetical protein